MEAPCELPPWLLRSWRHSMYRTFWKNSLPESQRVRASIGSSLIRILQRAVALCARTQTYGRGCKAAYDIISLCSEDCLTRWLPCGGHWVGVAHPRWGSADLTSAGHLLNREVLCTPIVAEVAKGTFTDIGADSD